MANGRNRRQTRSALDRMARVQRFPGIGTYDYGPAAAIKTDFGQLARDNLSDFKSAQETARKARERIDAAQKEAQDAQDYEHTGIASVDGATMSLATSYRNLLRDKSSMIGKEINPKTGNLYTINDFVAFKNNVINNSKIWKGHPELIKNVLEEYAKNEKLDPITTEAFSKSVGTLVDSGSKYTIEADDNGDIIIKGKDRDGNPKTFNLKTLAINRVEEIEKFDTLGNIEEFQDIYAKTQKKFQIDGRTYTVGEIKGNPLLFTKHIKTEPPAFKKALKTHLDGFYNDRQAMVSYLRQKFGTEVEYDHDEVEASRAKFKRGYTKEFGKDTGELNFPEKFNKIYLNRDGRFEIPKALKEKAKKAYEAQLLGAFGVEETVQVTKLAKATSGGSGSTKEIAVGELLSDEYKGQTEASDSVFYTKNEKGEIIENVGTSYKTFNPPYGARDLNFSLNFSSKGADKDIVIPYDDFKYGGTIIDPTTKEEKVIDGAPNVINASTYKLMQENQTPGNNPFKRNADLFKYIKGQKEPEIKKLGFFPIDRNKPLSEQRSALEKFEKDVRGGNIGMQGFSIAADLSDNDISQMGIKASSVGGEGRNFTMIDGLVFTYERGQTRQSSAGNPEQSFTDIERRFPKIPIAVRLVGRVNVVAGQEKIQTSRIIENKLIKESGEPVEDQRSGAFSKASMSDVAGYGKTKTVNSDAIPPSAILGIVQKITASGKNSMFEKIFLENRRSNNPIVALYKTMQQVQNMQIQ